jgi:hypothetical protein
MTKNPFINGFTASIYIVLVVLIMNFATKMVGNNNSFLVPIAVISLFTLSAAVMGYIFIYPPIQLYFSGKKKPAVKLFLQTTAVFACITIVFLIMLFTGIFSNPK